MFGSREAYLTLRRLGLALSIAILALTRPAMAQEAAASPDSAESQIRGVLRAFYYHLESKNWDALSPYVLSPKLLERRDGARERSRGASHPASKPRTCPATPPASIDEATIRLDGDWAEVSVPRCSGSVAGVDELRMLYFEDRWRFIYTDLFDTSGSSAP
jgi:hypothetical protein